MKCDYCNGTGKWLVLKCPKCGGTGVIGTPAQVVIDSPPSFNEENIERFPVLEEFKRTVLQPLKYGMDDADCYEAIESACKFFKMSMPLLISDMTERVGGITGVYPLNPTTKKDDIIEYNLQDLMELGVTSKDAFSLVMTHECCHRYLQDKQFVGLNGGSWEEELCCDFFMGVRAGLQGFPGDTVVKVMNGLGSTSGSDTHPTGKLRYYIIEKGYKLGRFDIENDTVTSIKRYLELYVYWLQNNIDWIRSEQQKLM